MAVTITLSTIPGTKTLDNFGSSTTMQLLGEPLGRETLPAVPNLSAIRAAVARFGAGVRAEHPGASFYVSVLLAPGQRKPNGFDAASRGNGLGQEDFLHVTDNRTKPALPAAPAGALLKEARA